MNTKLIVALCLLLGFQTGFSQNHQKTKKSVFIIVDGIAPDMLDKSNIPNMKRIMREGSFLQAYVGGVKGSYSESPTISAVGYNHVLTGVWTNKHNVWGNGIEEPNYNYPTVFRLFKDQYPDRKIAVFSTWLDNRTKLIGDNLPATRHIKTDIHYDGYEHDTINFPHDKEALYLKKIDSVVANKTAETIRTVAPDLSWVYLEHPDDVGHQLGDSQKLYDIISYEDRLIGQIYDAVKIREKKFNEDWLFIITTDHGRTAKDGKDHGGQSDRERATWIVMNKPNLNSYAKNTPQVAAVDILPTIADHLNLSIPAKYKREQDGVKLIGEVFASNLTGSLKNDVLSLRWTALSPKAKEAKIYITPTNHFKTGVEDAYQLIGSARVNSQNFIKKITLPKASLYKVVLNIGDQYLNTWIINDKK